MTRIAGRDYLRAKGRLTARQHGTMNKTEARFALLLDHEQRQGTVARYYFEGISFKIPGVGNYTPDFLVLRSDERVEVIEVKPGGTKGARWTPDARLRVKLFAATFPLFIFKAAWEQRGAWHLESFDRAEIPEP